MNYEEITNLVSNMIDQPRNNKINPLIDCITGKVKTSNKEMIEIFMYYWPEWKKANIKHSDTNKNVEILLDNTRDYYLDGYESIYLSNNYDDFLYSEIDLINLSLRLVIDIYSEEFPYIYTKAINIKPICFGSNVGRFNFQFNKYTDSFDIKEQIYHDILENCKNYIREDIFSKLWLYTKHNYHTDTTKKEIYKTISKIIYDMAYKKQQNSHQFEILQNSGFPNYVLIHPYQTSDFIYSLPMNNSFSHNNDAESLHDCYEIGLLYGKTKIYETTIIPENRIYIGYNNEQYSPLTYIPYIPVIALLSTETKNSMELKLPIDYHQNNNIFSCRWKIKITD